MLRDLKLELLAGRVEDLRAWATSRIVHATAAIAEEPEGATATLKLVAEKHTLTTVLHILDGKDVLR